MRCSPTIAALVLLAAVPLSAHADEATAYPTSVGDSVDGRGTAYWPVRVRSLDRIDWTYRGGKLPGMMTPGHDGSLRLMAGAGHLRAIDPATGKHTWVSTSNPRFWNYSSCVTGADGTAYFGNHAFVTATDATGERLWRTELRASWIHRPPALSPDGKTLYLVSDAIGLVSLDAATGNVNWLRRDWTSPWASLTFDPAGRVLIGTGHTVTCFDHKGAKLWQLKNGMRDLMVTGDLLLGTASTAGEVRCVDLRTRKFVWRRTIEPNITGMALGDDRRLRVTHASGVMTCLDLRGGVRWTTRVSDVGLTRPATALGGDALTVDLQGTLYLVDRGGRVQQSLATGKPPFRWRPAVGPDGAVYVTQDDQVVRVSGDERPLAPLPLSSEMVVVADDFVVDVWVNGQPLPRASRTMLAEVHGAMTERINVDLDAGDWIVFHVVANRQCWNAASYFGVYATAPDDAPAFSSTTRGNWSYCDDVSRVSAFISERDAGADQLAVAPRNPWHDAGRLWRTHIGREFPGEPVWGAAPSTWIKCIVPARMATEQTLTLPARRSIEEDYGEPWPAPPSPAERNPPPPPDGR